MVMKSWMGYKVGHCNAAKSFKTVRSEDPGCLTWNRDEIWDKKTRIQSAHSVVMKLDLDFKADFRRMKASSVHET
jgi:hypothetical protein